ncbi:hypothetical protein ACFWGI_18795 [Streptomyces niveus]|uniref:hypothetical protein n=1 Tax=Streptomyces niveus TaxID=193462 RepID=UPI00365B8BB4
MPQQPLFPTDPRRQQPSGTAPSHNYTQYDQSADIREAANHVADQRRSDPYNRTGADQYHGAGSYASGQTPAPPYSNNAPTYYSPLTPPTHVSPAAAAHGSQAPAYGQYQQSPTPTASYAQSAPMPWETERSSAISFATNAIDPVTPYVPDNNATSAAYSRMRPPAAPDPYGQQSSATRFTDRSAGNTHQQGRGRGQGGGGGGS